MKKERLNKKIIAFLIIALFFITSFLPNISGDNIETNNYKSIIPEEISYDNQDDVAVTCYNFGIPGKSSKESTMTLEDAEFLYNKIKSLQNETAKYPFSKETQNLQYEIIQLADKHNLLPCGVSVENLMSHFNQETFSQKSNKLTLPFPLSSGREFLCTFVSAGSGGLLPILVLPRFIPIIMTPIPRIFMIWRANEAVTSCGGLRSGTGFIAYGQQTGLALGFWGIGFTFSLPPVMGVFGLTGYALFSSVEAEYIEFYPPNNPPVISQIDPGDGEVNVPLSLSELRFQIMDLDGDLMSYTVTTDPDIGSGSGNLVSDGIYSVDVSGLEDLTEYTWHVEVTDGKDTIVGDYSFITEPIAPIVSDPDPYDGARYVSVDLSELSFYLKDYQGDPIDYTVETVPDIGYGSGTGVGEGTYSTSVSDLDFTTEYLWFVNASDGVHESRKVFGFQTEHEMTFDPFTKGWLYRKEVTIDHSLVDGDLENFPVLISTTDVDLRDKAQDDGDDILFMDDAGVADRLFHEIEDYDGSSGNLVAWVNIPDLDSGSDTVFYMYYGNSESYNQQAPELVWDEKYITVLHMNDGTDTNQILDSTIYENDGTKKDYNEPTEIYSKIGKAQNFDGSDDYIDTKDFDIGEDFTISLWTKPSSTIFDQNFIGKHTTSNRNIILFGYYDRESTSGYAIYIRDEANREGIMTTGWQFLVCTSEKIGSSETQVTFYKDGVEFWQSNLNTVTGSTFGKPWTIGSDWDPNLRNDFFNGIIDEVHIIKNFIRSSYWISTEYNNQNDPNSFYIIGPEET